MFARRSLALGAVVLSACGLASCSSEPADVANVQDVQLTDADVPDAQEIQTMDLTAENQFAASKILKDRVVDPEECREILDLGVMGRSASEIDPQRTSMQFVGGLGTVFLGLDGAVPEISEDMARACPSFKDTNSTEMATVSVTYALEGREETEDFPGYASTLTQVSSEVDGQQASQGATQPSYLASGTIANVTYTVVGFDAAAVDKLAGIVAAKLSER